MIHFVGTIGVNDNDVVKTTQDIRQFSQHLFKATAGAVTVQALVNGVWSADLAFEPLEAVDGPTTYVKVTTSTALYRLRGTFEKIRFLQAGATPSNVSGTHFK